MTKNLEEEFEKLFEVFGRFERALIGDPYDAKAPGLVRMVSDAHERLDRIQDEVGKLQKERDRAVASGLGSVFAALTSNHVTFGILVAGVCFTVIAVVTSVVMAISGQQLRQVEVKAPFGTVPAAESETSTED